MHHRTKFRQHGPNGFGDIAIFRFSRWLPSAILDSMACCNMPDEVATM